MKHLATLIFAPAAASALACLAKTLGHVTWPWWIACLGFAPLGIYLGLILILAIVALFVTATDYQTFH